MHVVDSVMLARLLIMDFVLIKNTHHARNKYLYMKKEMVDKSSLIILLQKDCDNRFLMKTCSLAVQLIFMLAL